MRGSNREGVRRAALAALVLTLTASGCGDGRWTPVPGEDDALKTSAAVRAERRAYDGAPPVIPHEDFGMTCTRCHDDAGQAVEGVGYAPASPHADTPNAFSTQRCRQCHVPSLTTGLFVGNDWSGLRQDLRSGGRLYGGAPPTIPHALQMRENCTACHAGPAAREEIRTSHPERTRCLQCHAQVLSTDLFQSAFAEGMTSSEGS